MERTAFHSMRVLLLLLAAVVAVQACGSSDLISEAAGDAALLLSYGD